MSKHYLIDGHTNPVTNSEINEVNFRPASNASPMAGNFVIRVDDDLDVSPGDIHTLSELLTEKYTAILAFYPGFANIVYDDMLDATGWNAGTTQGAFLGDRLTVGWWASGQTLDTNAVALGGTPVEAIVTWEAFSVALSNPKTGRCIPTYTEEDSATIRCDASFNNKSTFINSVANGGLITIAPADQGTQLVLRFRWQSGSTRLRIGSWACIY